MNRTVEQYGEDFYLVEWRDQGFMLRKGYILTKLRSRSKVDAETEARLQGLF